VGKSWHAAVLYQMITAVETQAVNNTDLDYYLIHGSLNTPWVHVSLHPKRHANLLINFCTDKIIHVPNTLTQTEHADHNRTGDMCSNRLQLADA